MALAMGAAAALIAQPRARQSLDDLVGQVFGHRKQPPPPPRPRNPQVARTGSVNLGDVLFGHHEPMPQRTNAPPVGRYRDDGRRSGLRARPLVFGHPGPLRGQP